MRRSTTPNTDFSYLYNLTLDKWESLGISTKNTYAIASSKLPDDPIKNKLGVNIEDIRREYNRGRRTKATMSENVTTPHSQSLQDEVVEQILTQIPHLSSLAAFGENVKTLVSERDMLVKKCDSSTRRISDLQHEVRNLNEQVCEIKETLQEVQEQNRRHERDSKKFREEHNKLRDDYEKLGSDYDKLHDSHQRLKTDHNKLRGEHENLKQDYQGKILEIEELKKTTSIIQESNQRLEQVNTAQLNRIIELNDTVHEMKYLIQQLLGRSVATIQEHQNCFNEKFSDEQLRHHSEYIKSVKTTEKTS
jgi:chromosome segregation ATPase